MTTNNIIEINVNEVRSTSLIPNLIFDSSDAGVQGDRVLLESDLFLNEHAALLLQEINLIRVAVL